MYRILQLLTLVAMLALLSACGDPDSSSNTSAASQSVGSGTVSVGSGTASVDLAWKAPTTRADGTYLANRELAGYRIYMGTTSNNLAPIVDLINDNTTKYKVESLAQGSYYFAISAYDQNGIESTLSQAILITSS